MRTEVFGPSVTVEDALLRGQRDSTDEQEDKVHKRGSLPWEAPHDRTVVGVGQTYLTTLADSIPGLGVFRRNQRELQLIDKKTRDEQSSSLPAATIAGGVIVSIGLLVGYMFHQGIISLRREEPETQRGNGLDAFGEAGAALSMYASQMDAEVQRQRILEAESNRPHTQTGVEVEVGSNGTVVKETIG